MNLRAALYAWRDNEAKARHVEVFRIFPNATLDAIAAAKPRTAEELLAVKGVGPLKFAQFGRAIFNVLKEAAQMPRSAPETTSHDAEAFGVVGGVLARSSELPQRPALSVAQFLDRVNFELGRVIGRVKGEVTQAKIYNRAIYFDIKDAQGEGALSCFMWLSDYEHFGVELEVGLEVIVEGRPEVFKPNGRFSLRAQTLELVGEGAFKKAYDALRKKLDGEGLFAAEHKRPLAPFPRRIGLITSRRGAVIHDVLNNLGKFGYVVRFVDSRVEGASAVPELLEALEVMSKDHIDALVIVRGGGGSLELLQVFNNERVVRAIGDFPVPVLCAIGHDKDVPLAQLVADHACSTPTACTALLNADWLAAEYHVRLAERTIFAVYESAIKDKALQLARARQYLERRFETLREIALSAMRSIGDAIPRLAQALAAERREVDLLTGELKRALAESIRRSKEELVHLDELVTLHDPIRQLRLGYSIIRSTRGVLRSVRDAKKGDSVAAMLADGTLELTINIIHHANKEG